MDKTTLCILPVTYSIVSSIIIFSCWRYMHAPNDLHLWLYKKETQSHYSISVTGYKNENY